MNPEILRKCPLFDSIEENNLTAMLSCVQAEFRSYSKNETILAAGTPARCFGIVLAGTVQIARTDYNGNRSILASAAPGEMFAEAFACAEVSQLPVDVTAFADTEVILVNAGRIMHTCSQACEFHNRMIFNLLKIVSRKNLVLNQKIEITSQRTTREKLLAYLKIQSGQSRSRTFAIPFDRQELADYLEVDRSGLSTEIGKLRKEGILNCKKNVFTLN